MNADPSDRQDSTATAVPVAICGMGMRLPGGIHDDATLYEFLLNGKDARSYTGCSRYDVRKFYDPTPRPGTIQTKHGYWLQDIDLSNFDTSMFKMSGPEVERLDPQQRLLLEVVWEAMQNAGETRWQGKEIGCYVGSFREDWLILHHSDPLDINPFEVSGSVDLALANRISYEFDFKGPSMTVKVGCSGSGTCLHLACQAIAHEDCTSAIVAGSSIILTPGVNQSLNGVGVFSAEGSCKSFDASADGYARAEAVNAIYVKRLDLAIRDGNPIRAVIRATAVNSDGNTSALVRPSADAHEQLIRKAYRRAGILNFSETAMVECHSTGTAIGDPIEADAIARVFGDEGIHIGWGRKELSKPKETSHIDLAPYAQPLTTALQVALVNLLVRWNITPSNVVGHSSGEIAAAYAAGVLDMEEAIIVSYFRGKVFQNRKRRGAMAAVALGRKEISSYLEPGVVIACENSAFSVTLSGDKEALETVTAALRIKEPSASIRNLNVDTAYHSPHMREVGEPYFQSIASHVKPKPPKVQMWSTVAGNVLPMGSPVSQKYWKTNLENPVLFSSAINSLLAECNTTVIDDQPGNESKYALHPITLDSIFQSLILAACKGELGMLLRVRLPTLIQEISVGHGVGRSIEIHSHINEHDSDTVKGYSYAYVEDELVSSVKGFCTRPLDVSGLSPMDSKVGYLQWAPDSSFQELGSLIKVTMDRERDQVLGETLFLLCALGARQDLEKATPAQPHLHKYRAWILLQLEKASRSENSLVKNSAHLFKLSPKDRDQMINMILDEAQSSDCRPIFGLILKIYNSFPQLFDGSLEPLSLLMQDYSLGNIYNTGNATWDYEALFAVMGHSKPQMKVLEIGGGTASLSENILQYLQSEFEESLYQVYTFTDISTGFLSRARERLHHYPNVDYQLLDISKDPEEQGLGKESYDLIIASNVVHVTPNLHDTLTHIRKLLRPDGRLFLAEICAVTKVFNFVMGILPSWWVGENDGRVDEPYIAPEEWHSRLYKAGFTQIEASISDTEPPFRVNATFMARTARQDFVPERVTLLSKGFVGKPARHVERMLLEMRCKVQHVLWGSTTPIQQDIISFIELEGPLFEGITDTDMEFFQGLVKSLRNVKMLWLMKPAQLHVDDPRFGLSLGMIRTIRSELGLVFATLELDDASSGNSTRAITEVFKHIRGKNVQRGRFDLDVEYVYSQGAVHVGRYHWSSFSRELEQRVPPGSANELIVGQLGVLQSLKWAPRQLDGLPPHDVRIKVHAVGLNFKDVLLASGILDLKGESAMLGIEGSGIVTAVGTDVANFSVGDRVMALSSHQSLMASEAQVASTHCIKIPNRLGFVEAATMPCVYLTVLRSLVDKAQLQRGQSILIHSASGGVGIAAITVARWIGAEVLVTAGTEEKRTFLMRQFGILPSRVFDSRYRTFVDGVRAITSGRGVDVVLNSVSGELLHASWECVASGGCMIELGKRDILGNGNLAMHPFGDNRSFIGIDLGHLSIKAPVIIERLLQQAVRLYENGDIEPINPVRSFSARKVQEASQHLRQGQHIGKVVLALTEGDAPELAPIVSTPTFRKDAAYLLVGGLGGLGGSIATWMASHGAGNLVTLSRSGDKSEDDRHIVAEIEAFGCSVQMFKGDVSKEEDVRHLVRNTSRPIAGMVHTAMVLSDAPVLDMTVAHWEAAINPKVKGAWNLHNVLPKDLDFFILFASLSGNLGYYGQSNYAAANTFLDAFVQYRHGLNLPASVIDLGAVEDVGFVSRHPEILKRLNNTFGQTVSEEELRNAFHLAVTRPGPGRPNIGKHPASRHYNASQIAVGLVPTSTAAFLARDPRLSVFYNLKQGQKTQRKKQDSKLDTFVDDIKTNPTLLDDPNSVRLISREIRKQVETLMMIEPQSDGALPTLSQIGVDSLVGIEIQNWWRSMFGVDVTLLQLLEADSFQKLGELAVRQLDELTRGERESPDETSSKEQSSALDNRAESHRTVSQTKPYDAGNNIAPSSPYYDMFREDHNIVSFEGKRLRDDGHVVILTGSTGTLGAYILLELLQMPNIHRVYCLCRSADAASRQIRGFQLQGLEVPGSFKNRVEYIRVDLPAPKLGMPDTKYEELRLSVDIVIHCAWELSFSKVFDIFERIHIRGLSRLFELSQRCQYRPHIHFMSSLLALYAKETQSSSSNVQGPGQKPASPWPIGYTELKLIAEEMCRLASTKWGLPTTVYRIGQIAGSSRGNGVVWDRNQWLPSIMHSSKLIRKVPNSLGPAEVTWMPVDQAAKAICEIFQSRSSSDGVVDSNVTFNVVNPCLTRWESLLPVIQKHYAAEVVESDIWLSEVEKHESLTGGSAETMPTRLLLPLYRQIMELFNHGWTRPSYDTARTNLASETLRNMGPITPEMMERWIQQWNF
ncbi:hypothetical protein CBS147482_1131 [Aspergillus niger]|nr:hypothetical protein CBS147482_1131 [Aspergillus niger]